MMASALSQLRKRSADERLTAGIASLPQGNGILVGNGMGRQVIGRSLLFGPTLTVENADGITGNPRISIAPGMTLIGSINGANLNSTVDQAITIEELARYTVTEVWLTNASATPTVAAGGLYTAPSKAGYTLVAATQTYTALTDSSVVLRCTLAAPLRMLTGPKLYFSLTTAEGTALTADLLVWGYWLNAR
jgi:hypothetical protein